MESVTQPLVPTKASCPYSSFVLIIAKLHCVKRASGAPWERNFSNLFGYGVTVRSPADFNFLCTETI